MNAVHLPAKRLAGFYFFYYATVGAYLPYWAPYLEARGFSPAEMGLAFGLMGITRSFVPLLWGWWSDHARSRMELVRWATVGSLLVFLFIPFSETKFWIGAFMVGYSFFWHALLSQFETVALDHLSDGRGDYSKIRLWGSVGFVVAVLGLGPLLDWTGMLPLPWFVAVLWFSMVAAAWKVPDAPKHAAVTEQIPVSLWVVLKRPEVLALLAVCLLSQMSFTPYYNFFTLFLERHGYSRSFAGFLWALGVVAEIGMFMVMGRMIQRVGARRLMVIAMAATALRWLLTATLVDWLAVLILVQLAHALSFGAYHAVAVQYVQRLFPRALQGRGQALYNGISYGVGGSIGSLVSGYVWEGISPEASFLLMAVVAGLGTWLALKKLPDI